MRSNFNITRFGIKLLSGAFFCLTFAAICFGQTAAPPLKLNAPVNGDFKTGETQTFALHLESNQFASVILNQKGVNLILAVDDAKDGNRLSQIDVNFSDFGYDRALLKSEDAPLDLLIRVSPQLSRKYDGAKFSLALVELKTADERDTQRIAAQRAILDSVKLFSEEKRQSKMQALSLLENGLKIARESRDSRLEVMALRFLQSAFLESGEAIKSIEFGKAALVLLAGQENIYSRAAVNESIGAALVLMGEYQQSIEILTVVLAQAKAFGEDSLQVNVLLDLSYGYLYSNEPSRSLELADQALQIAKKTNDKKSQIKSLITFAEIYVDREEPAKVLEAANQALSLESEARIFPANIFGNIYTKIALAHNDLGNLQKSLDYHQQALDYVQQSNINKFDEAMCLVNLAVNYFRLGQNMRSMSFTRQAISLLDTLHYKTAARVNLDLQGGIYMGVGDYKNAKKTVTEALRLARQEKPTDLTRVRNSYFNLGYIERKLGHYELALDNYLKSLQLGAEMKIKKSVLSSLMNASDMYIELEQMEKADETAVEGLETARIIGERIIESNALYNLARVRRAQQNYSAALRMIEDSLKIIESTRAELLGQEERTSYLSTVSDKYDFYISLLIEMRNQSNNREFGARAFAVNERARARGLLDLLAESKTEISAGINSELKKRERDINAKLSALQTQMIQLKSAEKQDGKQIANLQNDIQNADNERGNIEAEIRRTNPRYAALKYPATVDLKQTQALLDDQTVLLEYQTGANASYLFAVGKNEFQIIKLPNEKTLRDSVETLHKSLSTPARTGLSNYLAAGRELYKTLVAPVENLLKTKKKIIVAADGAIHYLPFEALLRNDTQTSLDKLPYLVRDFEISYTPSASVLANLKGYDDSAKPAKSFIAFAAPDYNAKTKSENLVSQNTRSVFGENRTWSLTDLQFAKTEAEQIAKLFPDGQSTIFTGAEATEERVKSSDLLSQYRYLHFAVHGLIDEEQPQFSSLILSLPKSSDQSKIQNPKSEIEEDGLLQTPEIFNLKLRADLVTLSACETGLGQEMRGEGIVGLTRAFFYAGTPSVLVSLWKVDDASTADLMTTFYENLRKNGERDKAAALRETQLKMISGNRYAHPYYWASFVLQGKTISSY